MDMGFKASTTWYVSQFIPGTFLCLTVWGKSTRDNFDISDIVAASVGVMFLLVAVYAVIKQSKLFVISLTSDGIHISKFISNNDFIAWAFVGGWRKGLMGGWYVNYLGREVLIPAYMLSRKDRDTLKAELDSHIQNNITMDSTTKRGR